MTGKPSPHDQPGHDPDRKADRDPLILIERIQGELEAVRVDLTTQGLTVDALQLRMFGVLGDDAAMAASITGRLNKIKGELEELKKVQAKQEQSREKYTTGTILAALVALVTWAVSRIVGGG